MPKGSLTVATNCRYCNKLHGIKAGVETHSAWMPREFPYYSCRIFVLFAFINARSSFHFYYFCPTHLRNRTNSSSKRHSSFIGSNIPKDEERPFAEGQARTEWHWLTASVTQPSLTCCLPMPPLSWDSLSGCCAVSLPPISFIFASRLPFIIHVFSFYSRYKDFMPKGSLTVATNCRYCNKPHGMKVGAETHSA